AINGLVGSLEDPYSIFLPPIESKMFEEDVSGSFEGVGMEVGLRDNILTVISPLKNTPADQAGLMAGDKIIQIDETPTYDLALNEAVNIIRGPRGTIVTLSIVREGEDETLTIDIVRDKIEIPVLESELLDNGIYVIELYSFYETAPHLFEKAITEFKQSGSDKLIIDLRNDPGGFLNAAVDIAGNFLPNGKLIARENFGVDIKENEHRTRGNFLLKDYEYDMVILINQGSASASEILAGALSEYNLATLVGEKSFGKGSVQELIKFNDGTSLKLTIARWLTPEGVSISEHGLTPDIEVPFSIEEFREGLDPQLDKAIGILLSK
ncbi:MAG: S41 family peptidase, partial [Candidatus Pacebacteria bacterium]|nr:S41 family peptidase [Candidatus Paceibacterota bacterium]